jgi:hypothetical protein
MQIFLSFQRCAGQLVEGPPPIDSGPCRCLIVVAI